MLSGIKIKINILAAEVIAALTSPLAKTKSVIRIVTNIKKRIAQTRTRYGVTRTKIERNTGVTRTSTGTKTKREVIKTSTDQVMVIKSHHPLKTRNTNQRTETKIVTRTATGVIRTNTAVIKTGTPVLKINTGKKNLS